MASSLETIFVDLGLRFIIGLGLVVFLGAYVYSEWKHRIFRKPHLSRTDVSLQIDAKTIYFPHIVSVCEDYVSSRFLLLTGCFCGFLVYMLLFYFLDFYTQTLQANMAVASVLTAAGGGLGYLLGLSRRTLIRDNSGCCHKLHLRDLESIEFVAELTKDIWDFHRKQTFK